jgi:NADPH:quinone reductase-like Zn-dependent oxidoreductase
MLGDWAVPKMSEMGTKCAGHEGAGVIVKVGNDVKTLKTGMRAGFKVCFYFSLKDWGRGRREGRGGGGGEGYMVRGGRWEIRMRCADLKYSRFRILGELIRDSGFD